jgi:hypothetical protein
MTTEAEKIQHRIDILKEHPISDEFLDKANKQEEEIRERK